MKTSGPGEENSGTQFEEDIDSIYRPDEEEEKLGEEEEVQAPGDE